MKFNRYIRIKFNKIRDKIGWFVTNYISESLGALIRGIYWITRCPVCGHLLLAPFICKHCHYDIECTDTEDFERLKKEYELKHVKRN